MQVFYFFPTLVLNFKELSPSRLSVRTDFYISAILPYRLIDKYFTGESQKECVTMELKLFKKNVKYNDKKDGNKEKTATNFYLKCNDTLIPIEVKFFANAETGKDSQYIGRKSVLSAFAEELPEKDKA